MSLQYKIADFIEKMFDYHIYCCHTCNRLMFIIWDVQCRECGKSYCYKHSHDVNGYWYCKNDTPTDKDD